MDNYFTYKPDPVHVIEMVGWYFQPENKCDAHLLIVVFAALAGFSQCLNQLSSTFFLYQPVSQVAINYNNKYPFLK